MSSYKWEFMRSDILDGNESHNENGDCAIKALCTVTGMSYRHCHKLCRLLGRSHGKGTHGAIILVALRYAYALQTGDYPELAAIHKGEFSTSTKYDENGSPEDIATRKCIYWKTPGRKVNLRSFAANCDDSKSYLVISGSGKYAAGCHITAIHRGKTADHSSLSSAKIDAYIEFEPLPMADNQANLVCFECGDKMDNLKPSKFENCCASCVDDRRKRLNRNKTARKRSSWDMRNDQVNWKWQIMSIKLDKYRVFEFLDKVCRNEFRIIKQKTEIIENVRFYL